MKSVIQPEKRTQCSPFLHLPSLSLLLRSSSFLSTNLPMAEFTSDGRWGEQADGPGVDVQHALEEFDDLRRELSRISRLSHRSNLDLEKLPSHATSVALSEHGGEFADDSEDTFDLESWIRNETAKDRESGVHPKRVCLNIVFGSSCLRPLC